jgi:hypothetical protein
MNQHMVSPIYMTESPKAKQHKTKDLIQKPFGQQQRAIPQSIIYQLKSTYHWLGKSPTENTRTRYPAR